MMHPSKRATRPARRSLGGNQRRQADPLLRRRDGGHQLVRLSQPGGQERKRQTVETQALDQAEDAHQPVEPAGPGQQ